MVQHEIKSELTQAEFITSMRDDIFQLPFNNYLFERIFPVETKVEGKDLIVDMSDGSSFKIQVTKLQ